MKFKSVTLQRIEKRFNYQVTLWADGVIRWDGDVGPRMGAWQCSVDKAWLAAMAGLVSLLPVSKKRKGGSYGSLLLESDERRMLYPLTHDADPVAAWRLAMLIDGVCMHLDWVPLDVNDRDDFSEFVRGEWMTLREGNAYGQALSLGMDMLLLAGSTASTSSAPTLSGSYQMTRDELLEDGGLALRGDLLVLTRHVLFESPSPPACLLTGHNANGRRLWRDSTGASWAQLHNQ
jgi:hypothetical protein